MAIDDNASYELTGYQVKDLASKIRAKADSNSLASVATSGLYSDLTGAPTIPTVYNGTLTIQQNGTTLGTFSANQSANETINITAGGGGASATKFYSSEYSDNANVTLYKDTSLTTHATYQEVIDALQGGGIEWVTIDSSVQSVFLPTFYKVDATSLSPDTLIYVTFVKQSNPIVVRWNTTQSNLSSNAVFGTQIGRYTLPTASSGTLGGVKVGSNLSISSGVLSANAMAGATSVADGASGYVPQPLIADESKYLKGDGTWDTPPNTTYTAGSNISIDANNEISATDTTYSAMTGATSQVAGTSGLVPAPAAGDQDKALKGDGTWGEFSEQFVIMKYGEANAWAKFLDAYSKNKIVYCRASSNANPATGSQTRMAFMAYVSNETTPTNVEFQYVRSVGSKTSSQPVDQVFVYKLESTNGGTWSVQTRDMAPKLAAGTGASVSYGSGTYTVGMSAMTGATSSVAGTGGAVPAPAAGDQDKVLKGDGTWVNQGEEFIGEFTTGSSFTLPAGYKIYHIRGFAQYSGASSNAGMWMTRTNRTGTDWLRRINGSASGVQWGEWSYSDGHFVLLGSSDALAINGGKVTVDLTINVANSTLWMTSGNFSHSGSQDSGVAFSETTTSDASADTTLQFVSTGRTFQAMDIIVTGIK